MDEALKQLIKNKESAIRSLTAKSDTLSISKSIDVLGDTSCNKLVCDSIEVRSSGNKTLINDAIMTKSVINSTPIGLKTPSVGGFTQINIISSFSGNKLNALKLDGDINISNSDQEVRSIKCLMNPLNITTNEYLEINAQNKIDILTRNTNLITNVFNINTSSFTNTGIFHILNNTNSSSLSNGSLIVDGGVAIAKNIILGGNINSHASTPNNIKGILNVENNISTSGIVFINNSNNNSLTVNGGVTIKKNTNIYKSLTVFNNLNILNNNNSINFIQGNTTINNNLSIKKNINCLQNLNIQGQIKINNNIDSINTNTGSLIINGGAGIAKNINIGGSTKIDGTIIVFNTNNSHNINTGSFITYGGAYITKNLNVNGSININNSTNINNNINIEGNSHIKGKTIIEGNLNILNNEESKNINTGSIKTLGGLAVKKNINTNGILTINNSTQSSNISTGCLVVNGGTGITKDLNVGGSAKIDNNLIVNNDINASNIHLTDDIYLNNIHIKGSILKDIGGDFDLGIVEGGIFSDLVVRDEFILDGDDESFDITSGSFITNGGVGIRKNLNVGKDLNVLGNATFNNNVNCIKTLYADNIHVRFNITSSEGEISGAGGTAGLVGQPDIPFDTFVGNLNISNNISVSNAFSSIDQWINRNLTNTPPQLVYTIPPLLTSEFIQLEFELPVQIYVGFLNKKLPVITDLCIEYKKTSESEYTFVNMNSVVINKIIIYPFNYTNYLLDNTYYLFNILKETHYDFRIYAKNNNTIRQNYYLEFNQLKTKSPQLLLPPTNINISNNINNPKTTIDLNWDHSISPNIPIYEYKINYSTINSIKYPNYINDNSNITITSLNIIYNSNNFTTINSFYPGHTYNIKLQARNILNNNFGEFSDSESITTDYPQAPSYISNNDLYILNNNNYYFNINSGYSLDGNTFINNIYNYSKLDNNLTTNILENIRINEHISSTELNTTKIITNLNTNPNNINIFCNLNLNGFSHTNNSTEFTNKFNIKLSNIKDFYNNIINNGFYKTTDLQITFNNSTEYLLPSNKSYIFQIQQNLPSSNINHKSNLLNLNIDKLESMPLITDFQINSISSDESYYRYISGVPTIINGNVNFDFKTKYLTNNYLRNDKKHFNINLITNNINFSENININSEHFRNSNDFYYNIDNTLHNNTGNTILPSTEDLLFKNQSIKINNINYNEDINLNINAYNLHGHSFNNYSTKIRLDNESIQVINNINNANTQFGLYVTSGNVQFPNNSEFGNVFNHTTNILDTSDLQLVNGYFSTPYNNNTFLNYTNYFNYFNNGSMLNYPNYSSVLVNDSFRYVTFMYNNIINDTNKITIEFIDSNIDELLTSNYQLHIKIINDANTIFNTAWLDANKHIDIIGLNNNTKNINGTGCLSMSNNYLSSSKKKYCYLPNGSLGTLFIKLGIKNNKDFLIKYIKVYENFI